MSARFATDNDSDAVDVAVELVSRGEARLSGFGQFDIMPPAPAAASPVSASASRLDQLPPAASDAVAEKLWRARQFLEQDEIDKAITIAHGVAWEYPALVAAKVVISRGLIGRGEYAKAREILLPLPGVGEDEEAMSCIDLSRTRERDAAHPRRRWGKLVWLLLAAAVAGALLWGMRVPGFWTFFSGMD